MNSVISTGISLAGTIAMYYLVVKNNVSVADYYSFNTAYGMVTGAFLSLAGIATTMAQIKPVLEMIKPVLEAVPEIAESKQVITQVSGAVYYDGRDLDTIDLKSLRRKIGVVMQNGKLFQGDIYSNIVISAPWLTMDDAWEAAEMAGIADDIRRMPMGMHTLISEGSGGVSGGQRQRLMIARAIAPRPRILMLDEAPAGVS